MRGLGTLVFAALLSGFVAGVVQLQMAVVLGSREEFIVASMSEILLVLVAAAAFGVVLLAGGQVRATNRVAFALAAVVVVIVLGLEAVTILGGASAEAVARDLPFVAELGIPPLLTVLIQWWLIRRHVKKAARPAAATA